MSQRLPVVLSVTALVVAVLGATPLGRATVNAVVPRDSVDTAALQNGAVTTAKVKDRSLLARDFKQGQLPSGPPGPQGPPGTIAGLPAGGGLAGSYPNPTIAADAVTGAGVADGTLRLGDTAVLSGQVRVDAPAIAAHSCRPQSAPVPGVKAYDRTLVLPTQNLSPGLFVTQIFNTNAAGKLLFRVCNVTGTALDPPLGGWAYIVWRP
jgi:hypothetical protein